MFSVPASRQGLSPRYRAPHWEFLDSQIPHFMEGSKGLIIAFMNKNSAKFCFTLHMCTR